MPNNIHFLDDNAISNPQQDLFNFKFYAEKVQKLIQLNSSNPEPITIGIYGKWGEGKTSFLNLIEYKIDHFEKKDEDKEYLIFHFNPWRYSNEDEMIFDFFDSLAKRFYIEQETTTQKIGELFIKYSRYLKAIKISTSFGIPHVLGTKIRFDPDAIFKSLGEDLKGEKITIEILKNKVNEALEKLKFKVVVFIDDLDRLDKQEIYTILKLIKLNANFKNFIFIVNIDSEHVAKAIKDRYGNDIEDGYLFLDKIINIPIHLPRIEREDLQYFFEINLKKILDNLHFLSDGKKGELLRNLSSEVSLFKFKSPREAIKILNSFFSSAFAIQEEVNFRDLFWVQFIKIRNEKCYNFLKNYSENFVFRNYSSIVDFDNENTTEKKREELLIEFSDVSYIFEKLFPKSDSNIYNNKKDSVSFNRELRINNIEHYDKYFSFHMERKISNNVFKQIEQLITKNNSVEISSTLKDLFKNSDQFTEHKIIYKIETIIQGIEDKAQRDFFFKCIIEDLSVIPNNNDSNYRIRIIELIGKILNDDIEIIKESSSSILHANHNKDISKKLANNLEIEELSHFVRQFYESRKIEFELITIFNNKAKIYISDNPKFYKNRYNLSVNKSIFYYLGNYLPDILTQFLEKELTSINEVKVLIRNFSPYYNDSFFGTIDKEEYDETIKKISAELIYNKVIGFNSNYFDDVYLYNKGMDKDKFDKSEVDENLDQFLYWYIQEKKLKALLTNNEAFGQK